jgi:hypothetical protein
LAFLTSFGFCIFHPPDMNHHPRLSAPLPLLMAVGVLAGLLTAMAWSPGCPVREATGLKCPSCGSGRALAAWLAGDVRAAVYWNALLLPGLLALVVAGFRKPWRWRGWLLAGGVILGFGVLRNLPFYLLY